MTEEFWNVILTTNLVGPFRCAHAARPHLVKTDPRRHREHRVGRGPRYARLEHRVRCEQGGVDQPHPHPRHRAGSGGARQRGRTGTRRHAVDATVAGGAKARLHRRDDDRAHRDARGHRGRDALPWPCTPPSAGRRWLSTAGASSPQSSRSARTEPARVRIGDRPGRMSSDGSRRMHRDWRRCPWPGGGARAGVARPRGDRPRTPRRHRLGGQLAQLRRHPRRPVLPQRQPEGARLRGRQACAVRVLREPRRRSRTYRKAGGGHRGRSARSDGRPHGTRTAQRGGGSRAARSAGGP